MKRTMATGLALGIAGAMCLGALSGSVMGQAKKKLPPAPAPAPAPAPTPAPAPPSSGSGGDSGVAVPTNATQLDAAKKTMDQAQTDYDTFVSGKKAEFEAGDAFQAAKKAVDEDASALAAAKSPLQEKLRAKDVSYAAAVEGLEPAKKKLEEALASKNADEITFRKYDVNHMQDTITKAETPVFSKNEAVKAAQEKLEADKKVLAAMQQKFVDFLNANPDYVALQRALANAQARVAALKNIAGSP